MLFENHQPYRFRRCNKIKGIKPLKFTEIYSFTGKKNHQYIVNIDCFQHNIYVVKFHLKSHKNSKSKYNLLTNNNDVKRILHTVVDIGKKIYSRNKWASFGFVGSPLEKEITKTKYKNTKRFRVYSKVANFYFAPLNFSPFYYEGLSTFLLMNNKILDKDENRVSKIVEMFDSSYKIEELFPIS